MSLRAISVRVNEQNKTQINSVTYNNSIAVKLSDNRDYRIKSIGYNPYNSSGGASRLSQLLDVDATDPDNDETLIYNESTQKYEIKLMNLDFGEY